MGDLMTEIEFIPAPADNKVQGGLAVVHTDQNGQATVTFPEPFAETPASIITTPRNSLVATGTLLLTETYVTVWVWDLNTGAWFADRDLLLYWLGLF